MMALRAAPWSVAVRGGVVLVVDAMALWIPRVTKFGGQA